MSSLTSPAPAPTLAPSRAMSPDQGGKRARVMAHQGAAARYPEHTLAAYRHALEVGADGIECDVHLTRDAQLVCVHDNRVDRTTNGRGPISEMTLAELRRLDWGSWRPFDPPNPDTSAVQEADGHRLVTLRELIELMAGAGRQLDLAIETKHPSPYGHRLEDAVFALMRTMATEVDLSALAIRIITFSAGATARAAELDSHIPIEYLAGEFNHLLEAGQLPAGANAFGPHIGILRDHPDLVARHLKAGHEVHPWTVDDPDDARFARDLGCAIITTNRPAEIAAALAATPAFR